MTRKKLLYILQNKPSLTAKTILKILIKRTLLPTIYLLDLIIPKKKELWIFPIGKNKQWGGNLKAVFDLAKNEQGLKPIILTHGATRGLCGETKKYEVCTISLKGIWYLVRSSVIVIQYHRHDFFWLGITNYRRIIFNLWHGITIKGVGFTAPLAYTKKQLKYLLKDAKGYSSVASSSKFDGWAISSSFNILYSKISITGSPRNDWLINQQLPNDLSDLERKLKIELKGRRLILYAPTFRKDDIGIYNFSADEVEQLCHILKNHNAVLGIRGHINRKAEIAFKEYEFLDLSQNRYIEAQVLLRVADALITDYSSIWVDYLLTNKPIIGFCYDWDDYMKDRGLLYDYNSIFPGPIAYNTNELIQALIQTLNGKISYEHQFKHQNSKIMFHEFDDGNASRRVIETILDMQRHS